MVDYSLRYFSPVLVLIIFGLLGMKIALTTALKQTLASVFLGALLGYYAVILMMLFRVFSGYFFVPEPFLREVFLSFNMSVGLALIFSLWALAGLAIPHIIEIETGAINSNSNQTLQKSYLKTGMALGGLTLAIGLFTMIFPNVPDSSHIY